jgi:cell division protease FtsH
MFLAISVANYFNSPQDEIQAIDYSTFREWLNQGKVKEVRIVGGESVQEISGETNNGQKFETEAPADPSLFSMLQEKGVRTEFAKPPEPPWWMSLLTTMLPVLLVIGAFFFIMQQTQGGGNRVMQFGKSRAKLRSDEGQKRVTFDDVAGIDEVKEELVEVVDFLQHPKKYMELGARIPKGVLLFGAPGTGKTLLARAVAGEADVPFFDISGSDFVEMFVGVGASRVRDMFEKAKKQSPCIVFIDEIDAVGRQRGAGYGGGHDEREQTLNQLLVEMDGFGVNEGIIVVAATNRPDVLDPALLRPGRFDRQIVIDRPDVAGREAILEVHVRGKPLADDVDLNVLARRTPGFTGADIENLVNEAALLAARRNEERITMHEMEDAIDRIVTGGPERKSRVISDKEKETVAFHEAAHALIGKLLPHTDPVHKISIIPRGGALGYVMQLPVEDRYLITKSEILDRVTMALAGRAAEELIFGEVSSGAQDDLEKATKMVRKMITEFGMSDKLGPLTYGEKNDNPFLGRDIARGRNYSEEVASAIDHEISHTINTCYEKATKMLKKHRDNLDLIANELKEKETLEGSELEELIEAPEKVS